MTTDLYRNGYDYGYEQGVAAERERAAAAIDALHPRVDALGARAEAAERRCAELERECGDRLVACSAAEKRCAELETDKLLVCETANRALKERDEWRGRAEVLERLASIRRDTASVLLRERDEARRVARVLVLPIERTDECELITPEERDAFLAACAYPEQKPEPREPSEELTRL